MQKQQNLYSLQRFADVMNSPYFHRNIFIETGSGKFFEPARKLFKSCGFEECDPFGHYKNDPNSCYMKIKV